MSTPDTPSEPVGLIGDRYRTGELLGTGGSASVFAAVDEGTGRSVALKVLHPHLAQRAAARDAFLAEAARALPLRHPNIVAVLGVGVDDRATPIVWIALERAPGMTVAEHVARHGPLRPADAIALAEGILRALEAAHAMQLVHRDVSPSNVMIAPRLEPGSPDTGVLESGDVRLLDFGLADAAGRTALGTDDLLSTRATGRAGVMGNVNYLSPEQARGDAVDARGDVYQVGALLHFALTGRPPFPRATVGETLRGHLEAPPPVPSTIDPRIPRALDRVVIRAMLKAPSDRFPSAAAMRRALLPGPSVRATHVTRALRPVSPVLAKPAPSRPAARAMAGAPAREVSPGRTWLIATVAALAVAVAVTVLASRTPSVSVADEPRPSATSTPTPDPIPSAPVAAQPDHQPIVGMLVVPDLSRFAVGEAVAALTEAGFAVGTIAHVDSASPRDTVLGSQPASGDFLAVGESVDLVVASGFHVVPEVDGRSREAAAEMVRTAGFVPAFAFDAASAPRDEPGVLGTEPAAGTVRPVGSTVTVIEAKLTAPTPTPTVHEPTPTSTPLPTPTPTPTPDE